MKEDIHQFKKRGALAFFWSAVNTGGINLLGLLFGILLARLLTPGDFGNMAIIIFIALISNIFVDSGLSHALIRESKVSEIEYNTIFYFSLFISFICALIIYLLATPISIYFNSPILKDLTRVISISPIIYAFMTVNNTIIARRMDFKLRAKLSMTALTLSGALSIVLANAGFGVWSLLLMQILNPFLLMVLMYWKVQWKPRLKFSLIFVKKYIGFGFRLSISNFSSTIYTNLYPVFLGKDISTDYAGYYSRANSYLPTSIFGKIILRAAYPFLSRNKDNHETLRENNSLIIKFTAMFTAPLLFGMAAIVKPLIIVLIGEKWLVSADILFYLCFAGLLLPYDSINMNIIKVNAKMNLYLALELFKILLVFIAIYITISLGIDFLLKAIILNSVIVFIISSSISGKIIQYKMFQYIKDIKWPFILSLLMFSALKFFQTLITSGPLFELVSSILIGLVLMIFLYELTKNEQYLMLKKYLLKNNNDK